MKTSNEVKIQFVRECPGLICDRPEKSLEYWENSITSAPWFSEEKEQMIVLILNAKLRTVAHSIVSIGSLSECMCHPRDVFRPAIAMNAYAIAIMHNHPSGDPSPSEADIRMTRRLADCGRTLQITVCDHVIIGDARHLSLRETGIIQ